MDCKTRGDLKANFFKCRRELLYEQCSLHKAENKAHSIPCGSRFKTFTTRSYSSRDKRYLLSFAFKSSVTIIAPTHSRSAGRLRRPSNRKSPAPDEALNHKHFSRH